MKQYYNLEMNILSCLLQKPSLMKQLKLEDKHFIKHQRIWQFMKAFYSKYETFDVLMMYQVCTDKFQILEYIKMLLDVEPTPVHFDKYQKQLIELYEQKREDKYIINRIFEKANDLYVGNISIDEFKEWINQIEDDADRLFKGGDE